MPLISVILPTYNRAWSLKRAIDSVFAQTVTNFELIVVNDGSIDETNAILKEYQGRIQIINQENLGASAARNAGISTARGEYVAFLDSDDEWLKHKLEAQLLFFEREPDYQMVQTTERWIRKGKFVNIPDTHKKVAGFIFEPSLKQCMVTCSSGMMKKKLLDEVGLFNESLPACEDYDLWLRIVWKYPVGLIEKDHLVRHGGHADQLSSRFFGCDRFRIRSILNLLLHFPLAAEQKELAVRELCFKCRVYAEGCMKRGKTGEGERFLNLVKEFS
jgi:glycosyltransferase involved in cell wall biosynthesis